MSPMNATTRTCAFELTDDIIGIYGFVVIAEDFLCISRDQI